MPVRIVVIALLSIGYLVLSQWLMTTAPESPWTAAALLGPMLAGAALAAWNAGERWRATFAAAGIVALLAQGLHGEVVPAAWLYVAQHAVINLGIAWWFADSLRTLPGRVPVITRLASLVHAVFTPAMATYTRNVTRAWVAYFVGIVLLSLVVFLGAPFETWAWFANLATPVSLVAMFVGERFLRYRLHPEFERSSLLAAINAYRATAARPAPPEPR